MHKLLSSSAATTDLLYGFEKNDDRRRKESTNNKETLQKGTFQKKIWLIDTFVFADQDKVTYGFEYKLILKRDEID